MYLILTQIHLHIFGLAHQIHRMINTLKKEETLFETNAKFHNMKFKKIKIWERVASHKKVITKDYYLKICVNKPLLSIIFSNIVWVAWDMLVWLFQGQNCKNVFILSSLRCKRKKYVVLILPLLILLVSISYWPHRFASLLIKVN